VKKLGVVINTYNSSTAKTEAGGLRLAWAIDPVKMKVHETHFWQLGLFSA
jgi:hypothetical protein